MFELFERSSYLTVPSACRSLLADRFPRQPRGSSRRLSNISVTDLTVANNVTLLTGGVSRQRRERRADRVTRPGGPAAAAAAARGGGTEAIWRAARGGPTGRLTRGRSPAGRQCAGRRPVGGSSKLLCVPRSRKETVLRVSGRASPALA